MTFEELREQVKKVDMEEKRTDLSSWLEVVVSNQQLEKIHPILERYFGPPFKAAGQSPSKEALRYTASYGGIRRDQTLYYAEREGAPHFAMMWPWGDGLRVTVKIAQSLRDKAKQWGR
jgi:hypothetical protein